MSIERVPPMLYFIARYEPNSNEVTFHLAPTTIIQAFFLGRYWLNCGHNVFLLPLYH